MDKQTKQQWKPNKTWRQKCVNKCNEHKCHNNMSDLQESIHTYWLAEITLMVLVNLSELWRGIFLNHESKCTEYLRIT